MPEISQEKTLSERILDHSEGLLGAIIAAFVVIAVTKICPPFLEKVLPEISRTVLLVVILLVALIGFVELLCILQYRRQLKKLRGELERKLTPSLGVLWDKDKHPYCPSCKSLLAIYKSASPHPPGADLRCLQCDKSVNLYDNEANLLTLKEAQNRLNLVP